MYSVNRGLVFDCERQLGRGCLWYTERRECDGGGAGDAPPPPLTPGPLGPPSRTTVHARGELLAQDNNIQVHTPTCAGGKAAITTLGYYCSNVH